MKRRFKQFFGIVLTMMIVFSHIQTVDANDYSNGDIHNSTGSGTSGHYDPCGLRLTPTGGLVGYRLTVVETDDDGKYSNILAQRDYRYTPSSNQHINGSDSNFYVNTGKSISSTKNEQYCKTRFGVLNNNCINWTKMNGKTYYDNKSYSAPINSDKKRILNSDYNWKLVDKYYSDIADDPEQTYKLLKKLGVNKSKFSSSTTKTHCANGTVVENGSCDEEVYCDSTKLSDKYKNYTLYYDDKVGKCVSSAGAPTESTETYYTGDYACYNKDYPDKNGTKCLGAYYCPNGTWLEGDNSCRNCRLSADGNPRTTYTEYHSDGYCYDKDGHAKYDKDGNQIGRAQIDANTLRKEQAATAVTATRTKYSCPDGFYDDEEHGNCRYVHGDFTYHFAKGFGNPIEQKGVAEIAYKNSATGEDVCPSVSTMKGRVWIIIEPMFTIATQCSGRGGQDTYFGTATELAKLVKGGGSAFRALRNDDYFKTTGAYLYMKKNSFKENSTTTHTFKPIKGIGNGKISDSKYTGDASHLYKKDSDGNVWGIGSGIIVFSSTKDGKSSIPCKPSNEVCPDDPDISISNCIDEIKKTYGFSKKISYEVCRLKECENDEEEKCKYCTDEGKVYNKVLTHSEIVDKVIKKIQNDSNINDNNINVDNLKKEVVSDFQDEYCKSDVYDKEEGTPNGKKFTCEDKYMNSTTIEITTKLNSSTKSLTCPTALTNKYGTYLNNLGNCSIYCKEKADLTFPGNTRSIHAGSAFAWPSLTDDYKMTIDYSVECTAINPDGESGDTKCDFIADKDTLQSLIGFDTNKATISYENKIGHTDKDSKYKLVKEELELADASKVVTNFNEPTELYDKGKLTLSTSFRYYLPKNLNYYVDNDGNYYNKNSNPPIPISDLTETGGRQLATQGVSRMESYLRTYSRGLHIDLEFGNQNSIGKYVEDYTCEYSVFEAGPDECVCPEGTKHAGESLRVLMACDQKDINCPTSQKEFCNLPENAWTGAESTGEYDKDGHLIYKTGTSFKNVKRLNDKGVNFESCKCENCEDNGKVDITECLKKYSNTKGFTALDYCLDQKCRATCSEEQNKCTDYHYCKYIEKVPKGNNRYIAYKKCYPTQEALDNDKNGLTGVDCKDEYDIPCEDGECKKEIIFRTVELTNPFPGQNGKTRTPGLNWNEQDWINNKLKNVKIAKAGSDGKTEYNGNQVYNKAPLYKITLTPEVMKKIRNDINKNYDYAAYKDVMSCNGNGNSCNGYYMSKKLRDTIKSINNSYFDGECGSATNSAALKKCYNDYSSSSVDVNYDS